MTTRSQEPLTSASRSKTTASGSRLTVAGFFAGIGGIELGLLEAGHDGVMLCEIEPGAQAVLRHHFPQAEISKDIRKVRSIPPVDVVVGGFPCQDLSQAGRTAGIDGKNSGLVGEIFRLIDSRKRSPKWLMLENVSFMLQLDRGKGMRYLIDQLEKRGFTWAYRVVDSRSFGVPQRRQRVILLASKTEDPRPVLFADDAGPRETAFSRDLWCGFYWTEGLRGLGWAVDAVPTLKGGSTIGIPSPPAIWIPKVGDLVTPEIRDAERLQGFAPDWTLPALEAGVRPGHRWKLVGNAVSVPVARWVGQRLASPGTFDSALEGTLLPRGVAWPKAAWGHDGEVYSVSVSMWPLAIPTPHLSDFIEYPMTSLSHRAAAGFLGRADVSGLNFNAEFIAAVRKHVSRTATQPAVA